MKTRAATEAEAAELEKKKEKSRAAGFKEIGLMPSLSVSRPLIVWSKWVSVFYSSPSGRKTIGPGGKPHVAASVQSRLVSA